MTAKVTPTCWRQIISSPSPFLAVHTHLCDPQGARTPFVTDGVIERHQQVRVTRDGIVIESDRRLDQLKRFKDDVKEVAKGFECGLNIEKFNDLKVGDVVEAYEEVEVKQTLED